MKTIRLFIADDHELVRRGLAALVGASGAIEVVGESGSLDALPSVIEASQPDVLLLDVKFPQGDSYTVCGALKERWPDLKVLFLTSHGSEEVVFACIESGANGFLLKDVEPDQLVHAIHDVSEGKSILDPSVTSQVFKMLRPDGGGSRAPTPPQTVEKLSPQEMRILKLVAEGLTNNEVAEELGLSPKTVKNYLSNAMGKLGFSRRAQAAAYWVKYYG